MNPPPSPEAGPAAWTPEGLDLLDEEFAACPYPALRALREDHPVHHDDTTGLWLVSRHADVRAVLLDPGTFRNDNTLNAVTALRVPALRALARADFVLPPALFNNSEDSHTGLRALALRFLSAARVRAGLPDIEGIVAEELDLLGEELDRSGRADIARTVARSVPIRVLLGLLGIEKSPGVDTLYDWTQASIELFWGRPDPVRQRDLAQGAAAFYGWLTETVRRTDVPANSVLGALRRHRLPGGTPLATEQAASVLYNVLVAGHVTTGQFLCSAFLRALDGEGTWRRLAQAPQEIPAWLEEVLRRDAPLTAWRRVTARPVTLGGVALPAGAELLLLLTSSGWDTEVFDEPDRLCPARPNLRAHLAFGTGVHRCPGAELARAEGDAVLRLAVRRFPGLRRVGPERPPYLASLAFRAPRSVLVSVR
ncbi:cytochrome P450 [Streptomyces sp. NPDC050856]|uniref:cytochrome P450 n=1 Tax=Streptomyces sp. NPDC050856 TaxID=3154939 RepID=UPI0033C498BE